MIDVHALLVAAFATVNIAATTELVRGWAPPVVLVRRYDGAPDSVAMHLDRPEVQLDCYAATEAGAWALATSTLAVLKALPGQHGAAVVSAVRVRTVRYEPDPDVQLPRVIVQATVTAHP